MTIPYETAHRELLEVIKQRDAARALADQLAHAVIGDEDVGSRKETLVAAMEAWRARDWRPISPPGSGVDGLMADINREKP